MEDAANKTKQRKLKPYELRLVQSVPTPTSYENKEDQEAVQLLKDMSLEEQAKVLKILKVSEANPFSVRDDYRRRLLDAIAKVGFKVPGVRKGYDGGITTGM